MEKYLSQMQVLTLLTILLLVTSCNGQVKKDLPKDTVSKSKIIAEGQPKLVRNLGSLKDKGFNVNSSLQDKDGNLWFGTTGDGVYKYDGKTFTQFTTPNGTSSLLGSVFLEDKSGKIWMGTADGVCVYENNKFTKIEITLPNDTMYSKFNVSSIIQDKSGKLWFASNNGVYVYDGNVFNYFKVTDEVKDCLTGIEKILEDNAGNLWFGGRTCEGVFRYDGKSITNLKLTTLMQEGFVRPHNWGFPHLQDKKGNIWFSNWGGVYRYDGKSFTTFTRIDGLAGNMVAVIKEDSKGNIWFGGEGLTRYDGKNFTRFTKKDGLLNNDVWTILEDKTGAIWVGTRETILHRFDGKTFTDYSEYGEPTENLMEEIWNPFGNQNQSNNEKKTLYPIDDSKLLKYTTGVRSILEDSKGNIWFGSHSEGVCLLHNGEFQYFTTENGLSDNQVRSIYEDKNGIIWFECGRGLSIYDGQKMTIYKERNFNSKSGWKLTDSDLWFKGDETVGYNKIEEKPGVYQYDGKNLYFHNFPIKPKSGAENAYSISTPFVKSKNGMVWFGTYSAVIGYDGKQFKIFNNDSLGLNGTTESLHIRSIMEDSKGNLWIGNNSGSSSIGGIGVLKYDGKEFIRFTKQHQLRKEDTKSNSLDRVFSIEEDASGNIWFGTVESGVWRYDGNSVKNYTQKDGLDGDFTWIIYKSKAGELWFGGGPNGVYLFNGKTFERKY
jgi:ligand-binding sensor domain-containing protein